MVDVDAGRGTGQGVRLIECRLGDNHGSAAARQHGSDARPPVVGLVVDDPVGDAARLGLPRPHEGRSVAGGVRQRLVDRLARDHPGAHAFEGASERVHRGRLHGVDPGQRGSAVP